MGILFSEAAIESQKTAAAVLAADNEIGLRAESASLPNSRGGSAVNASKSASWDEQHG